MRQDEVRGKVRLLDLVRQACCLGVILGIAAGCATADEKHFTDVDADANVYAQKYVSSIKKVAIVPFKAPTELIGSSISDLFVTEMLRAGRYTLVERGQMANVLAESELALSGLSDAQAIEVAQMLGAEGVIVGTVSEYGTVAYRGHPYPSVGVSARLIDAGTGQIVWSVDHASRARSKKVSLSKHARTVVHEACAMLYQRWQKQKRKKR